MKKVKDIITKASPKKRGTIKGTKKMNVEKNEKLIAKIRDYYIKNITHRKAAKELNMSEATIYCYYKKFKAEPNSKVIKDFLDFKIKTEKEIETIDKKITRLQKENRLLKEVKTQAMLTKINLTDNDEKEMTGFEKIRSSKFLFDTIDNAEMIKLAKVKKIEQVDLLTKLSDKINKDNT